MGKKRIRAYSYAVYKHKVMGAYACQKFTSKQRGIEFLFTRPEWIAWWVSALGPNWPYLRGRRGNEYCMARFNDVGPYAPWNVKCITNLQNREEGFRPKGSEFGRSGLNEDIVEYILTTDERAFVLAKRFGVTQGTISDIRCRRTWRHVKCFP